MGQVAAKEIYCVSEHVSLAYNAFVVDVQGVLRGLVSKT